MAVTSFSIANGSVADPRQIGMVRIRICGSVLWLIDPDPDPAIFVIDFEEAIKSLFFRSFPAYTFWKYIYIIFKDKKS